MGSPRSPLPMFRNFLKVQAHAQVDPTSGWNAPVERLPIHIIWIIGSRCHFLRDVLSLSLCNHRLQEALRPILYSTVELKSNKHCKTVLATLAKRPEITQYIQKLLVHPNRVEWTAPGDELNERIVANLIINIAADLESLHTFSWDGLEAPHDNLWLVLRTNCPRLVNIGTCIGEEPLTPNSHLYSFSGLRRLSLKVNCRSYDWITKEQPSVEKLPRRFWEMLLERCPALEELTIGGVSPAHRMFDIRHVMSGRWARLRRLMLGDAVLQADENSLSDEIAVMEFFKAHPRLDTIALQHAARSMNVPYSFVLPHTALPCVQKFSGPLSYVRSLPHPSLVRHLTLTSLHHTASSFTPTLVALQDLPSLISLTVWIDMTFGTRGSLPDEGQMFRSLLAACPRLLHLDIVCLTRPTFHIGEFSKALRTAPHLESFVLTKLHKSSEEDMLRCATRIVEDNPNLKKFTLRFALESWFSQSGGRLRQMGMYEVHTDVNGGDRRLLAFETGMRTFGAEYSRQYVHNLPPPNTKAVRRETWSPRSSLSRSSRRSHKSGGSVG